MIFSKKKDAMVESIREQLEQRLSKIGHVSRRGDVVYIRPSSKLGWRSFSKADSEELYRWLTEGEFTNLQGDPFRPNDPLLRGSFYFKI